MLSEKALCGEAPALQLQLKLFAAEFNKLLSAALQGLTAGLKK